MKVRVYWNLHRRCYSVMDASTNRVISHTHSLDLTDVTFVVRPAGQRKVRETGRKNVHAFIVGTTRAYDERCEHDPLKVSPKYNPYEDDTFTCITYGNDDPDSVDGGRVKWALTEAKCATLRTFTGIDRRQHPRISAWGPLLNRRITS